MLRVRKGIVYLLSLVLLLSLIGTVLTISANQTLGKPEKVENMLAKSKLYDHFVAYTADQAKQSEGDTDQSGSVSLSDAAVQTAAQSSFPPRLIQQSIDTFLDSNYAWLEGKTTVPDFRIDLSAQKADFAQKVGQYVKTYAAGLPICTDAQALQEQGTDPLAATCRPAVLAPEVIGAQVTDRLSNTDSFLSNPVITASSVNPKGNQQGRPYYEKLSSLPKLYRIGTSLPYVFGILSILSALGVIFISVKRRRGVRKVAIILMVSGIVLVLSKFIADFILHKVEHRIFNSGNVGQLQQSLTDFAHRIESAMVKTDLLFGVAFLVLALIIFGILLGTRRKEARPAAVSRGFSGGTAGAAGGEEPAEVSAGRSPLTLSRKRFKQRPAVDGIMPGTRGPDTGGFKRPEEHEAPVDTPRASEPGVPGGPGGAQRPPQSSRPKKPPRLVQ